MALPEGRWAAIVVVCPPRWGPAWVQLSENPHACADFDVMVKMLMFWWLHINSLMILYSFMMFYGYTLDQDFLIFMVRNSFL